MNKLTRKEKKFADGILEGKTRYQAALDAYDIESDNKISVSSAIATEKLEKPRIIEYLLAHGYQAATNIVKISNTSKNDAVRLAASKDILDRSNIGVKQQINAFQFNFNSEKEQYA